MVTKSITLSFDFELGWGSIRNSRWIEREQNSVYDLTRDRVLSAVERLKILDLSTTWGVVGAMVEEKKINLNHLPDIERQIVDYFITHSKQSTRCGIDLLNHIKAQQIHEICSHSYSHLDFTSPHIDDFAKQQDLLLANSALERHGISAKSLIWPEDKTPSNYMDLLPTTIKNIRVSPYYFRKSIVTKIVPFPSIEMYNSNVRLESGTLLVSWDARKKSSYSIYKLRKKILDFVYTNSFFRQNIHISAWLHPFNLALSADHYTQFFKFIDLMARLRDHGWSIITLSSDSNAS